MPKATPTPITAGATAPASTRRRVLGGAVLAALTGGAFGAALVLPNPGEAFPVEGIRILRTPSQPSPDAALLADCAAFDTLEAAYRATDFEAATNSPEAIAAEAEQVRITVAQYPLVERMTEHQAVTLAGQVARARSLVAWKPELVGDGFAADFGECLISAILRDMVGGA